MAAELQPVHPADEEIAEIICARREYAGRRYAEGEYVALLDGQIVAVGGRFEDVRAALSRVEPDLLKGLIFRVETPVEDVIR